MALKNSNYRVLFGLFTLVLSLAAPKASKACHLAAADIYIEYAGAGVNICNPVPDYTYKVTFITYSYCNCGLTTSQTAETISYTSANAGGTVYTKSLNADPMDTVDQLCPQYSAVNECRTGNAAYPGFYRIRYSGIITLPSAETDWRFYWSSSARNPSVNLNGTGSLYIEAGMDVVANFYNNTPKFLSNPLPYICANQPYNYLNLPTDYDPWDSNIVVTNTANPLNGFNAPIGYAAGYSPTQPIGGYSLNTATGTASILPAVTGQYTLSFRANDKSSYVLRDVQIAVLPCTAPPPSMDSVAQNLVNATLIGVKRKNSEKVDSLVYVCPGSTLSFTLNGKSENSQNNVYMRADNSAFNGSTFTTSGGGTDKVTGTFTWTPTTADYGLRPLVVTTVDSSCIPNQPIVLTTNAVIPIMVVPGIDAGPDQTICELNPQPIQLFVKGADNLRLQWSVVGGGPVIGFNTLNIHNPTIKYPFVSGNDTIITATTQGYIVTTVDLKGTCRATDTVIVSLDTSNGVRITPKNPVNPKDALVVCRPAYLQLEALIKGRKPMNNVACGISNPTLCATPDNLQLYGSPIYGSAFYDSLNPSTPVMYTHLRTAKKEYLITKEDLWTWGLRSATLRTISFEMTGFNGGSHDYSNFTISMKCTKNKELNADEGFQNFGMTTVYSNPKVTLNDGWQNFKLALPYNWDTTQNLVIQICYSNSAVVPCGSATPIPVIKYASTSYAASLTYKPADSNTGSVCGIDKNPEIIAGKLRPVFKFEYCEADPLPFDIKWQNTEYLSDSTIPAPLAYVEKSGRYFVQVVGRSTCIQRDTLDIYVPKHDIKITPEDTAICFGDKSPFAISGGTFFKWYEYANGQYIAPNSIDAPSKGYTYVSPTKTTDYRIVVSDSVFCYDTISAKVTIMPLPNVRILNQDDTVVKYGQSFQLLATGARYYNWNAVGSLNNTNISYPIARPTEDTRYIVGGIGANGCRSFDTLHVIVDKRDNLFVPSAFSPNGDGKNDVFKITNLSFQRIMEFRVFNHWGQEIFRTNDSFTGWDGTWQGVPQEVGTYTYLIRVAYPDGYVETYKGETNLVR